MTVADYIVGSLADKYDVRHVFQIVGGGAMHLNDAVGRNEKIQYISNQHEQACAIAAEGYARISKKPGVVIVTSGPGATNTLTGVMGAWVDSIPMVVISGQVKRETTILRAPRLRQLGDQEINIVDIAQPLTKYCVMVNDPEDVRYHLERAMHLTVTGRPGPVWLDIPVDVQSAQINPDELRAYDPAEDDLGLNDEQIGRQVTECLCQLKSAERPVIVIGSGVALSGAAAAFAKLAETLGFPILTAISGIDLVPSDSPLFFGRPGIIGERCANFILQNSDCVLILGTRMSIRHLGYDYRSFAREAYKIMVDIDAEELSKPTLEIDLPIHADLADFIGRLAACLEEDTLPSINPWLEYCSNKKQKYPVVLDKHRAVKDCVSSYVFPEALSEQLEGHEIVVTGNGTAFTSTFQAIQLKAGVSMFASSGCGSMGYGLPAAIGAAVAGGGRPVICITGDGSIQMNLQELQTVLTYGLPMKIFMYSNDGYLSLKNTQSTYFAGRLVGANKETGVIIPDMKRIAAVYGYPVFEINNHSELEDRLPGLMQHEGPLFCVVKTDPMEFLEPKAGSKQLSNGQIVSRPLEDLAPFLPTEEFLAEMIIAPIEEK